MDSGKRMEEMGFVPKAVSEPAGCREPLRVKHMCDKKCNEEGFNFCDLAAIVADADDKPHTIHFCRNCYHCRLTERGEPNINQCSLEKMIRHETSRDRLWAAWAKQLLEEATKAVQLETHSSWQNESPYKEELELLRVGNNLRFEGSSMRQASKAGMSG